MESVLDLSEILGIGGQGWCFDEKVYFKYMVREICCFKLGLGSYCCFYFGIKRSRFIGQYEEFGRYQEVFFKLEEWGLFGEVIQIISYRFRGGQVSLFERVFVVMGKSYLMWG